MLIADSYRWRLKKGRYEWPFFNKIMVNDNDIFNKIMVTDNDIFNKIMINDNAIIAKN